MQGGQRNITEMPGTEAQKNGRSRLSAVSMSNGTDTVAQLSIKENRAVQRKKIARERVIGSIMGQIMILKNKIRIVGFIRSVMGCLYRALNRELTCYTTLNRSIQLQESKNAARVQERKDDCNRGATFAVLKDQKANQVISLAPIKQNYSELKFPMQ